MVLLFHGTFCVSYGHCSFVSIELAIVGNFQINFLDLVLINGSSERPEERISYVSHKNLNGKSR